MAFKFDVDLNEIKNLIINKGAWIVGIIAIAIVYATVTYFGNK